MNISIVMIIALIIINAVTLYRFNKNNETYEEVTNLLVDEVKGVRDEFTKIIEAHQNYFDAEKLNENLKLNKELTLLTIRGDTVLTKDVFKRNSIVFRYSMLNCNNCIETEINILIKNKTLFNEELCIIAHYKSLRNLNVFYKTFKKRGLSNIKMYLLPNNDLGIPLEKYNIPYYFHIDSNLTMSNFFVPIAGEPKLSTIYLNHTLKNFFTKK